MGKALRNPSFPFLDVQKEFLDNQLDTCAGATYVYEWRQPNIKKFAVRQVHITHALYLNLVT